MNLNYSSTLFFRRCGAIAVRISSTAISEELGIVFAGLTNGTIIAWDLRYSPSPLAHVVVYNAHKGDVSALCWLPRLRLLCSGGVDHEVKIWDPILSDKVDVDPATVDMAEVGRDLGELVADYRGNAVVQRYCGTVYPFLTTSQAIGGTGGSIRLCRLVQTLADHRRAVTQIAYASPYLVTIGSDGNAFFYAPDASRNLIVLRYPLFCPLARIFFGYAPYDESDNHRLRLLANDVHRPLHAHISVQEKGIEVTALQPPQTPTLTSPEDLCQGDATGASAGVSDRASGRESTATGSLASPGARNSVPQTPLPPQLSTADTIPTLDLTEGSLNPLLTGIICPTAVTVSRDGETVFIGDTSGNLHVFTVSEGRIVYRQKISGVHPLPVSAATYLPSESCVVTVGYEGTCRAVVGATGQPAFSYTSSRVCPISSVAYLPRNNPRNGPPKGLEGGPGPSAASTSSGGSPGQQTPALSHPLPSVPSGGDAPQVELVSATRDVSADALVASASNQSIGSDGHEDPARRPSGRVTEAPGPTDSGFPAGGKPEDLLVLESRILEESAARGEKHRPPGSAENTVILVDSSGYVTILDSISGSVLFDEDSRTLVPAAGILASKAAALGALSTTAIPVQPQKSLNASYYSISKPTTTVGAEYSEVRRRYGLTLRELREKEAQKRLRELSRRGASRDPAEIWGTAQSTTQESRSRPRPTQSPSRGASASFSSAVVDRVVVSRLPPDLSPEGGYSVFLITGAYISVFRPSYSEALGKQQAKGNTAIRSLSIVLSATTDDQDIDRGLRDIVEQETRQQKFSLARGPQNSSEAASAARRLALQMQQGDSLTSEQIRGYVQDLGGSTVPFGGEGAGKALLDPSAAPSTPSLGAGDARPVSPSRKLLDSRMEEINSIVRRGRASAVAVLPFSPGRESGGRGAALRVPQELARPGVMSFSSLASSQAVRSQPMRFADYQRIRYTNDVQKARANTPTSQLRAVAPYLPADSSELEALASHIPEGSRGGQEIEQSSFSSRIKTTPSAGAGRPPSQGQAFISRPGTKGARTAAQKVVASFFLISTSQNNSILGWDNRILTKPYHSYKLDLDALKRAKILDLHALTGYPVKPRATAIQTAAIVEEGGRKARAEEKAFYDRLYEGRDAKGRVTKKPAAATNARAGGYNFYHTGVNPGTTAEEGNTLDPDAAYLLVSGVEEPERDPDSLEARVAKRLDNEPHGPLRHARKHSLRRGASCGLSGSTSSSRAGSRGGSRGGQTPGGSRQGVRGRYGMGTRGLSPAASLGASLSGLMRSGDSRGSADSDESESYSESQESRSDRLPGVDSVHGAASHLQAFVVRKESELPDGYCQVVDAGRSLCVIGHEDGSLTFLSLLTGSIIRVLGGHGDAVLHVICQTTGALSYVFSCGVDGSILALSVPSLGELRAQYVTSVEFGKLVSSPAAGEGGEASTAVIAQRTPEPPDINDLGRRGAREAAQRASFPPRPGKLQAQPPTGQTGLDTRPYQANPEQANTRDREIPIPTRLCGCGDFLLIATSQGDIYVLSLPLQQALRPVKFFSLSEFVELYARAGGVTDGSEELLGTPSSSGTALSFSAMASMGIRPKAGAGELTARRALRTALDPSLLTVEDMQYVGGDLAVLTAQGLVLLFEGIGTNVRTWATAAAGLGVGQRLRHPKPLSRVLTDPTFEAFMRGFPYHFFPSAVVDLYSRTTLGNLGSATIECVANPVSGFCVANPPTLGPREVIADAPDDGERETLAEMLGRSLQPAEALAPDDPGFALAGDGGVKGEDAPLVLEDLEGGEAGEAGGTDSLVVAPGRPQNQSSQSKPASRAPSRPLSGTMVVNLSELSNPSEDDPVQDLESLATPRECPGPENESVRSCMSGTTDAPSSSQHGKRQILSRLRIATPEPLASQGGQGDQVGNRPLSRLPQLSPLSSLSPPPASPPLSPLSPAHAFKFVDVDSPKVQLSDIGASMSAAGLSTRHPPPDAPVPLVLDSPQPPSTEGQRGEKKHLFIVVGYENTLIRVYDFSGRVLMEEKMRCAATALQTLQAGPLADEALGRFDYDQKLVLAETVWVGTADGGVESFRCPAFGNRGDN